MTAMLTNPMPNTHNTDDTSALSIALDLHALAEWVELPESMCAAWAADNSMSPAPPPLSRPLSYDRTASIESILSSSSSTSTYSLDEPEPLDDLDSLLPRRSSGPAVKQAWTAEEDRIIAEGVAMYGNKWSRIRKMLPATSSARTEDSVRNRWQRLQRKQSRRAAKGARAGDAAGCKGGGASKYGDMWSAQEDAAIESGVIRHGLLFRDVAAQLPGRTESGVRNRWLRNVSKRLAARGVHAVGAPAVFAALRESGELGEGGKYRPLAPEQPTGCVAAAAFGFEESDCGPPLVSIELLASEAHGPPPPGAIRPHRQHASLE